MTRSPSNPFQELSEAWASIYPLIHWSLEHPVGSLFLAFGGLYLFWGLFRGLIHLTENLWIRILRAPLSLTTYLWRMVSPQKSTFGSLDNNPVRANADPAHRQLSELIAQIEDSHHHQEQLLQRAKAELKRLEPDP